VYSGCRRSSPWRTMVYPNLSNVRLAVFVNRSIALLHAALISRLYIVARLSFTVIGSGCGTLGPMKIRWKNRASSPSTRITRPIGLNSHFQTV